MASKRLLKKEPLERFINWIIYMLGYSIVLLIVDYLFVETINIDTSNFGLWFFIATIIIYILNMTIKPILVTLTIPLTGITLGLFYPFINVLILHIVDLLMGSHFQIKGIFYAFFVAILISIMNAFMDTIIIEPFIKRRRKK